MSISVYVESFGVKQVIVNDTDGSQKDQFSLIHIPLPLYTALLQPILRVLHPREHPSHPSEFEDILEGVSTDGKHGFLNISVTPIECSIVCHTTWAQNVFAPVIARLPRESSKQVQISKDTYNVFDVISAGIEEGQRVMDVAPPLAMAGIHIFFIPTYYTNFILAPSKDHHTVARVLLAYGFEFSENDSAYLEPSTLHRCAPNPTAIRRRRATQQNLLAAEEGEHPSFHRIRSPLSAMLREKDDV
jgi:hypothetical protein